MVVSQYCSMEWISCFAAGSENKKLIKCESNRDYKACICTFGDLDNGVRTNQMNSWNMKDVEAATLEI
jgi:hypothetical protein